MNLRYTEYGEQCMCSCCYHLTYFVDTEKENIKSYQLNGKKIIETAQVFKEEHCDREYHDNGELKKVVCRLDDEVVFIKSYDLHGVLTKTEYSVDGKLIEKRE
jgi:hypothetical protein